MDMAELVIRILHLLEFGRHRQPICEPPATSIIASPMPTKHQRGKDLDELRAHVRLQRPQLALPLHLLLLRLALFRELNKNGVFASSNMKLIVGIECGIARLEGRSLSSARSPPVLVDSFWFIVSTMYGFTSCNSRELIRCRLEPHGAHNFLMYISLDSYYYCNCIQERR